MSRFEAFESHRGACEPQDMYDVPLDRDCIFLVDRAALGAQQVCQFRQGLVSLHPRGQSRESWRDERPDSVNTFNEISADFLDADVGGVRGSWLFISRSGNFDVAVLVNQRISTCLA